MAFDGKEVLGIIPARGGSKGLPRKNVYPLDGIPLINYSIRAGLRSKYVDSVIVSSDDPEILRIAEQQGAGTLQRPVGLATDSASPHAVIAHALETLEDQTQIYDMVILLQPTSPLRNEKHVDEAFELLKQMDDRTSLISVYFPEKSPYKCFISDESGYLKGLVSDDAPFMNRQDLPQVFMPNGAIYIFGVKEFSKENRIPMKRAIPYIMTETESIDIDTLNDVKLVEKIMQESYR